MPAVATALLCMPLILEVNSDLRSEPDIWEYGCLKGALVRTFERVNYRAADHIIVVAEGIKRAICELYGILEERVSVVPNGADLNVFRPLDRLACRRALDLDVAKHYAAFAGTFQRHQGLRTIVQAARELRERYPELRFLIVGDGPQRTEIEAQIRSLGLSQSFDLPRWCSPPETALYLGASDLCLAPYTRDAALVADGFRTTCGALMKRSPLKLYTYLAAGRPVVASHFAEAGEYLQEAGAGLSVPPDDPVALAQAIAYLLDHPEEAERMGRKGRNLAETRHTWSAVAAKVATICAHVEAVKAKKARQKS